MARTATAGGCPWPQHSEARRLLGSRSRNDACVLSCQICAAVRLLCSAPVLTVSKGLVSHLLQLLQ